MLKNMKKSALAVLPGRLYEVKNDDGHFDLGEVCKTGIFNLNILLLRILRRHNQHLLKNLLACMRGRGTRVSMKNMNFYNV